MDYEQRLLSQETQTSVIFDKILQMEKLLGPHFLEYMSTDASPSSSLRINPKLPSTCDFNNNLHSRNNSITNPSGLRSASTTGGRTSFNTNNDDSAHSILDVHSAISIGGVVPGKIGKQLDIDDVSCDNTTALSSPENRLSTASDLAPAITSSTGSPFSKQRKSMTVAKVNLMEDFMKLNSEESVGNNSQQSSASLFSGFIDGLIDAIQPHETQLLYRASVIAWIRRQIRKCINCTAIEMSFHELRCFLPDDPIKLSLILCKGRMTNWHTMIIDRLNYLAERAIQCGPTYNILAEEDIADYHFDEPCPLVNHVFHHVGFVNGNTGSNINGNSTGNLKICLHVDSSVEVEIGTNQRAEAALLAFYQEFADLVGKNQLFKRSLLLVRSWWFYETAAYIGSTIKSYLTESTLTMMVVAIFNQHHKQLLTPLHVLVMFLVEYCDYDGANNVITLQGVVPLKEVAVSSTNNISGNPNAGPTFIPELNLVSPEHLINDELIDKYSEILNIPHDQDESNAANEFLMLRTTSSEDVDMDNAGSSIVNSSSMSNLSPTKVNSPDSKFFGQESQFNNRNETMPPFEKNGFNVLNPFNNSNMVLEKLSNRRLSKIAKAFQIGTANLSAVLRQGLDTLGAAPIIGFFPVIKSRFVDNWRPDAISNSIERNLDLRLPSGYEEYEKKYV